MSEGFQNWGGGGGDHSIYIHFSLRTNLYLFNDAILIGNVNKVE